MGLGKKVNAPSGSALKLIHGEPLLRRRRPPADRQPLQLPIVAAPERIMRILPNDFGLVVVLAVSNPAVECSQPVEKKPLAMSPWTMARGLRTMRNATDRERRSTSLDEVDVGDAKEAAS